MTKVKVFWQRRWRTCTFALAVIGLMGVVGGPIYANRQAVNTSCENVTESIRASQGIPRKYDGRGQPIPTPSEVYVRVLLRRADRRDLKDLQRAVRAYPPLRKATCDMRAAQ